MRSSPKQLELLVESVEERLSGQSRQASELLPRLELDARQEAQDACGAIGSRFGYAGCLVWADRGDGHMPNLTGTLLRLNSFGRPHNGSQCFIDRLF